MSWRRKAGPPRAAGGARADVACAQLHAPRRVEMQSLASPLSGRACVRGAPVASRPAAAAGRAAQRRAVRVVPNDYPKPALDTENYRCAPRRGAGRGPRAPPATPRALYPSLMKSARPAPAPARPA